VEERNQFHLTTKDASRRKEVTKTKIKTKTSSKDTHENQSHPLTPHLHRTEGHKKSTMKFSVTSYHAVAVWKWDTHPTSSDQHKLYHYAAKPSGDGGYSYGDEDDDDDDDEEDDVCGICRLAFESTCPECKIPGDDCPLSKSMFYSRLITKSEPKLMGSMGRMYACVPYALSVEMDRYGIVKRPMSNGPKTMG